jgi:hypothetical protein
MILSLLVEKKHVSRGDIKVTCTCIMLVRKRILYEGVHVHGWHVSKVEIILYGEVHIHGSCLLDQQRKMNLPT